MKARLLWFHPAVEDDVAAIVDFYVARDARLPRRFRARLREQLDRIELFPESGALLVDDIRRVVVKRFPYIVVYTVRPERIDILAVVSVRRDPSWILQTGRTREDE